MNQTLPESEVLRLHELSQADAIRYWDALEAQGREEGKLDQVIRLLCQADLYYLLVRACGRQDMLNEFAFSRCREVEASPNGHLD